MAGNNNSRNFKTNKKFNGFKPSLTKEQTYLQARLDALMPTLMTRVIQKEDGQYLFSHPIFPDLQVEGITLTFVEEHVERAIKRHFRGQSNKHVDYLFALLCA